MQPVKQVEAVSLRTLFQSTVAALVLAAVCLVVLILPAEYNIDPTGLGEMLGLTALSPVSVEKQTQELLPDDQEHGSRLVELLIPARGGLEYKLSMKKHASVEYEWVTNGTLLYVDMHGEPEGDTSGYFKSYVIATVGDMKGSFDAAFDGTHGWYWKNTTSEPVPVLLILQGEFEVAGSH